MLRIVACISFLAIALNAGAQDDCNLTISGQVIDEHDGSVLSLADIIVIGQNKATISSKNGFYTLSGLCAGEVVIVCSHVGCETIIDTLYLENNMSHNFYPEHHTELLNAVHVNSNKTEKSNLIKTIRISNPNRLKGNTLGESLATISGVNSLNTGAGISKPVVHGLHSNRLLVLNNGVRQEGQQWGSEHAPEIDPFTAGEISVIKGSSNVEFGPEAIAGVVLIRAKALPDSFGLAGEANLVGQSNGRGINGALMLEGRSKRLSAFKWRAQGSVKKVGNQNTPDYHLKNTGIEELNFSGTASLGNSKRGIEVYYSQFNTNLGVFSASHIGNLTDLQLAFESDSPIESAGFDYTIQSPYQSVSHELLKAKAKMHTGEKSILRLTYARQYNIREEFDKHSAEKPALSFEITTHTIDLNWEWWHSEKSKLKTGASTLGQNNTYDGRFFIPNFTKKSIGFFAIEQIQLHHKLLVEFGARLDYILQDVFIREGEEVIEYNHVFSQPSGSFSITKTFDKYWVLRSNIGTAWRPPNVNELYSNGLHHGSATFEIGDTSLLQEVSFSWDNEIILETKRFKSQVSIYVNYMNNFINLQPIFPATLTIRGAFPTYQVTQTDALIYGIDGRFTYQLLPSLKATSTTSIVRAKDLIAQDWVAQMPADQSELALEFNIPMRNKNQDVFLGANALWVNRQWRIPSNSDYVAPPKSYLLFGFDAGYSHKVKFGELGINLEINNLLNQRYRSYLNRYRYYAHELGRNFLLRLSATF